MLLSSEEPFCALQGEEPTQREVSFVELPGGVGKVSLVPEPLCDPPLLTISGDDFHHGVTDVDGPLTETNSSVSLCTVVTNAVSGSTLSVDTSDSITDDLMASVSAPNLCRSKEGEEEEEEEETEKGASLEVVHPYLVRSRAVSSPVEMVDPVMTEEGVSTGPCDPEWTASEEGHTPVPIPAGISSHSKDRRHRRSQSASVAELLSIQNCAEQNSSYNPSNGLLPDLLDNSFGSEEQVCPSPNNTPHTESPVETDDTSDEKMEAQGTSPPVRRKIGSYDSGDLLVTNIDDYQDESHDCSDADEMDDVAKMPLPLPPEHDHPHDRNDTPLAPLPDDHEDEEEERIGGVLDGSSYSSFEAGDLGKSGCHGDDVVRLSDVDVDVGVEMSHAVIQTDGAENTHILNQLDISREKQDVSPLIERRNLRALPRTRPVRSSSPNTSSAPQPLSKEEVTPVIRALRHLIEPGGQASTGPEATPTPSKQSLERHGSTLSDSYIYNNHRKPEHNLSEHDVSNLDYGTTFPNEQSAGPASLSPLTIDQRSSHTSAGSMELPVISQKKYSTPTPVLLESGHQPLRLTLSDDKCSPTTSPHTAREGITNPVSAHTVSPSTHTTLPTPMTSFSPLLSPSSLSPSPSATSPPPPPPPPPLPQDSVEEESGEHRAGLRLSSHLGSRDDSHTLHHESSLDREQSGRPTRPQSAARSNKRNSKTLDSAPLEFLSSEAYLQRSESLQIPGRNPATRRDSDVTRSKAFKPCTEVAPSHPAWSLAAISEPPLDSPPPPLRPPQGSNDSEGEALDEQLNVVADLRTDNIPELALPEAAWYKTITKQTMRKMKKEERERQEIIHELAITQKHHVRTLNLLDLVFRPQLSKYLSEDVVSELFPGLDDLLAASKAFDARLEKKRSVSSTVDDISDVLLEQLTGEGRAELLKAYSKFCSLHMNALEVFKEQMRKKNIRYLLKELHSLKDCQRLTLPDFYQSISQHLTKLVPVMHRLAKKTDSLKLPHTNRLNECTEKFLDLVASVDKAVSDHEKHVELLSIHNRLEVVLPKSLKNYNHLKGLSLIAHNRTLKKRGDAIWMGNGKQMSMMLCVVLGYWCILCVCVCVCMCVC